jgi:hypothetical protein
MYIFASFDQGAFLEIAIADLTRIGLTQKHILAVPMRKTTRNISVFDRIYRADGVSILDGAALTGTVCTVLGVIFGSVLYWGPIIWGLLGLIAGSMAGLALDWVVTTRKGKSDRRSNPIPVVLIVRCEQAQAETVEKILEEHHALALARHLD